MEDPSFIEVVVLKISVLPIKSMLPPPKKQLTFILLYDETNQKLRKNFKTDRRNFHSSK